MCILQVFTLPSYTINSLYTTQQYNLLAYLIHALNRINQTTVLYFSLWCCTLLYIAVLYSMTLVFIIVLYYTVEYSIVKYSTILYYTVLYCIVIYYTVLLYTKLYCTVLYCTDCVSILYRIVPYNT